MKFTRALIKEQRGSTGIEAGLLLLGLVIASSTLTVAVTLTGMNTAERSTDAVDARVIELLPVLKVNGLITGTRGGDGETVPFFVESIRLPLTTYGATPVSLDPASMTITYFDREQFVPDIPWTVEWIRQREGGGNGNNYVLTPGDLVEVRLDVSTLSPQVAKSGAFTLQLKPAEGAITTISSTIPGNLSPVIAFKD